MQLFEWGVQSRATGGPGLCPIGITDTVPRARARMLAALEAVPAGVLTRGWVLALALGSDRLTYDRLDYLVRVTRDGSGVVEWQTGGPEHGPKDAAVARRRLAELARLPDRTVVDGRQLRELRRARGLSQENLAWKARVGITTLARLELEDRPRCRRQTLARLA